MSGSEMILEAQVRESLGKSDASNVRGQNRLPAVVYGPEMKENVYVTIDYKEFEKLFKTCGKHQVITLNAGKKKIKVIVKDYIIHPITRNFQHIDFYAVSAKKPFTTEVPVKYTGNPIGVKEGGGLYIFTHKLKITTTLANLPASIDVDITNLKIGQYLIVRDIQKADYKVLTHEGTSLVEVK